LQRFSQPFVDDVVLGGKYSYWGSLSKFWEKERVVFTSGQLADVLRDLCELMGLESFSFFLFVKHRKLFAPVAYVGLDDVFDPQQAEFLNTIYSDDPLVRYLEREKRSIIRDELASQEGVENREAIVAQMDEIKAQVSIPLFVAEKLTAILNLGRKKSGDMFHERDMELIKEVAKGAQRHLSHIAFFDSSLLFSGSVAHDITKPFRRRIIYDYLKGIRSGPLTPMQKGALDDLGHCLENLHNMSERMVGGFEDLETFLRSGFKPKKIDYVQKVNEESKPHKMMAEEKGLSFEIVVPKKALFLYADPLSVQRILNELLTNAIKYTDRGKITVKVSQENPKEVLTEISDTGRGIPEEDLDEIWELFKRAENDKKTEGTGIGLAMVRQLIEANGGKIWVNSDKDKRSKFFFTLPVWEEKKVR
jgi:signal transduction histidine kinase